MQAFWPKSLGEISIVALLLLLISQIEKAIQWDNVVTILARLGL